MNNQQTASVIKNLAKQNKIAVDKVLIDCKINKNFIYDIEKRNSVPSIETLEKIADYFNVSTDYLLGREQPKITVDSKYSKLIDMFESLNTKGRIRAIEYLQDLDKLYPAETELQNATFQEQRDFDRAVDVTSYDEEISEKLGHKA
jgi:transcriptional regulator with XRE-family HTH domain